VYLASRKLDSFGLKNPTLNRLLSRLKHLRRLHGLTQERFAEKAGISYKYYQAVEAGRKKELRLSTLERLARAYGLEVYQLLSPDAPFSTKPGKVSLDRHPPLKARA
jgi:transcriptional regulator with XRE-family HTH domain